MLSVFRQSGRTVVEVVVFVGVVVGDVVGVVVDVVVVVFVVLSWSFCQLHPCIEF